MLHETKQTDCIEGALGCSTWRGTFPIFCQKSDLTYL